MAPSRGKSSKRSRAQLLSHGRPPTAKKPAVRSAKATRSVIRSHHQLQKARAAAKASGQEKLVAEIDAQIEAKGGLKVYQEASITGQSASRGGDSSKVLVEWCRNLGLESSLEPGSRPRLLEVGALSVTNACSKSGLFDVTRIDLHSQGDGILQQDFMERPLPATTTEMHEIISLSLVLNYVPDAVGRGEMLRRIREQLKVWRSPRHMSQRFNSTSKDWTANQMFPSLFLVLPAPCVTNSRYLDEKKLEELMHSLGFRMICSKISNKLAYSLWRLTKDYAGRAEVFPKVEVHPGKSRNNFAIILK